MLKCKYDNSKKMAGSSVEKTVSMNMKVLILAVPSIISNITVPLLSLVDMAIVGHLGSAAYIGAVAVGGLLFNVLYWNFGFLRMGTSGLASQAYGRRGREEYLRVSIDTENYRAKREEALRKLAIRMAGRAKKSGDRKSVV